jgi:hypothetical protein
MADGHRKALHKGRLMDAIICMRDNQAEYYVFDVYQDSIYYGSNTGWMILSTPENMIDPNIVTKGLGKFWKPGVQYFIKVKKG